MNGEVLFGIAPASMVKLEIIWLVQMFDPGRAALSFDLLWLEVA